MIKLYICAAILLGCFAHGNMDAFQGQPTTEDRLSCTQNVGKYRKSAVTNASPFERTNTFDDKTLVKDPIGYFIYDMSVYRSDFTNLSYLYLCELSVDFTPGSVAVQNEEGAFDWHYDFWSADVSLGVSSTLSQGKVKDFWPKSSSVTVSVTSSYSNSYTMNLNGNYNLGGGASIGTSSGGGYTISHSVTTATEDPSVSSQLLSNNPKNAVWNIRCTVQRGLTYNFSCFFLIEMPKTYSPNFSFSSSIKMTCIAWKGHLWEQRKNISADDSISAN